MVHPRHKEWLGSPLADVEDMEPTHGRDPVGVVDVTKASFREPSRTTHQQRSERRKHQQKERSIKNNINKKNINKERTTQRTTTMIKQAHNTHMSTTHTWHTQHERTMHSTHSTRTYSTPCTHTVLLGPYASVCHVYALGPCIPTMGGITPRNYTIWESELHHPRMALTGPSLVVSRPHTGRIRPCFAVVVP